MEENIVVLLMFKLLKTIEEAGVGLQEARCAIEGAKALLPELGLERKPTMVIECG